MDKEVKQKIAESVFETLEIPEYRKKDAIFSTTNNLYIDEAKSDPITGYIVKIIGESRDFETIEDKFDDGIEQLTKAKETFLKLLEHKYQLKG